MLTILGYVILGIIFYNIPSLIAVARLHNNGQRIVMMNMAFGWTIVGWCLALKWSLQPANGEYSTWPCK